MAAVAGNPGVTQSALRHEGLAKLSFSLLTPGWKRDGKAVDCGLCSLLQLLAWTGDCSPGRAPETPGLSIVRECCTSGQ